MQKRSKVSSRALDHRNVLRFQRNPFVMAIPNTNQSTNYNVITVTISNSCVFVRRDRHAAKNLKHVKQKRIEVILAQLPLFLCAYLRCHLLRM